MKKILFILVALVAAMSMNAQVMKIYKGGVMVASYTGVQVDSVVFKKVPKHQHTLTLASDTVFPTDETTGHLAYWECTGTEEDPGCHLYFADSLATDTIGNDSLLNVWLAKDGDGFLPYVYENNKVYAVIGDTLIVRTDRISEMKNVVEDSLNYFHMTYTFLGEQQTYHAHHYVRDLRDGVVFKTGEDLTPVFGRGTATRTGNVDVKWIQLWENGPKFAEYNVGAENNKAEDCGGYYCWGSSIDKDPNGVYKSGSDALSGNDDTATNLWGENWRMPTDAELQALLANCDVEWTDNYNESGGKGNVFTGKGDYASNSVFLPAAGECAYGNAFEQGDFGYYWSSTPDASGNAGSLRFMSGAQMVATDARGFGFSVRAVLVEE